jgi:hypothetical protein
VSVELLLYLIAFALLILATLGLGLPRVAFGWAGLAVLVFAAYVLPAF